ncbi:phenylalanine--tRNA ligase subunit beta [Achromobacter sp. GG226]|uniref:phenylalanine--tRNA ligase subunit beta n=1 Tax=Verticiella alkaliphila TaxID=2779529 RepID=UPI001C0D1E0A|nr:phenylalanine--tRNA ligase subunit beta [Verticiella sp. GG226]MBU4609097.1 phenylalanine--tRNA ligase subunit beta [Verticiella sp. GG226]
MQFPESWLRAFVDPALDTEALAHQLTMAGLEVEDLAPAAPPFSGVVVAHVLEVTPHPDADKLRVCSVDDGSGAPVQIVCGAPNVAVGLNVPLARIGAELPGGMRIGKARMRGVESFGMLCSARELGLSQEHAGLLVLDPALPAGAALREALDLDDTVFEIKLTPNKADCLSVLGVAREVSALTGAPLTTPAMPAVAPTLTDRLPVTVQAPDLCGRFAGRVIRGVNARAATPDYIRTRLERAGQRSISALVDISNYVMLELGRPSHVFDLAKLHADGLVVRWARPGESLALLNGQTVELDASVGVVAAGEGVESLAGIMGGDATAVSLDTQDIYVEAAFWWPESIAGRARRFNFATDAGHRFERGVDYASIPEHLEYLTALILDVCGGQAGPLDDQVVALPERKPVRLRTARCRRVLGIDVSDDEIASIFTRLNLPFTREADAFVVSPPSYRFDLEIEEDLIEEVARVYGFERIPDLPPMARATMRCVPERVRPAHALREAVAAQDYQEVVNFSFVEEAWERDLAGNADPIRLLNPIASQLSVMRSSLLGGLIENIRYNANRKQPRVRVFELGRVFRRDATVADGDLAVAGIDQPLHLAGAAWGPAVPEQWGVATRAVDFFDVKADIEALAGEGVLRFEAASHPALHPGRSARVLVDGAPVGWLGELHPRWLEATGLAQAPVLFEVQANAFMRQALPVPAALSRQPSVSRDLALWVAEDVPLQSMLDTVAKVTAEAGMDIVQHVSLFDVYRDKSLSTKDKSLAFRFRLQDTEVTLDDARVDACMDRVRDALIAAHGARQRV